MRTDHFTTEHAEEETYRNLVRLVQLEHDEEKVKQEIARALHENRITREQVHTLAGLFYVAHDAQCRPHP